MLKKFENKFLLTIKSRGFRRFVFGFFIFEAVWIALTAAYPQAFDENFHYGVIKIYSHHWLPFLSGQPAGADTYGAVARDPSYLYHYLMSFPYRFIALFTHSQTTQVILLRLINIGLFTYGLYIFRRILIKTKVSEGLSNLIILLFAFIPIAPQLAGQINYDNLLFPAVAVACLLSLKLIDQIKQKKPAFVTYMSLLIVCFLTGIVKYAFLPIFLAIGCFFLVYLAKQFGPKPKSFFKILKNEAKKYSTLTKVSLSLLLVLSIGLFAQRDIVNLVRYDTIAPSCSAVLTDKQCDAYAPWLANTSRHQMVVTGKVKPSKNPIVYFGEWVYWMWYRLFFAINGASSNFTNYPPLPLPSAMALIVMLISLVALIRYRKKIFRSNPYVILLSTVVIFYSLALIAQGYSTYQFTAVLENMNGRYLLPVLILAAALIGRALTLAFNKNKTLSVIISCLVLILAVEGGGLLTFISRSDQSWDFNNSSVIKINNATRRLTSHLIIHGKTQYTTKVWFFN